MNLLHRSFCLALAAMMLSACGGGAHGGSSPSSVTPQVPQAPAASSSSNRNILYGSEIIKNASFIGKPSGVSISIGVLPRLKDAGGLITYAQQASDPASGLYRHFLLPTEIADRFGVPQADYTKVARYFTGFGLHVVSWKQRLVMQVSGPQSAMEAALGAYFGTYRKNGRTFVALTGPPTRLSGLPIAALTATTSYKPYFVDSHRLQAIVNERAYGYAPQQVATAFDYAGAYAAGFDGKGVNVGIIGTGPVDPADLPALSTTFKVGVAPLSVVPVTDNAQGAPAGTFATAPPVTSPDCTGYQPSAACNPSDVEASLDTEQIASLAPKANVLFYLGYEPNQPVAGQNQEGISLWTFEAQQVIHDNVADVLSISIGGGEQDNVGSLINLLPSGLYDPATSLGPLTMAALAAQGITTVVSSGDDGALECRQFGNQTSPVVVGEDDLCVSYPSSDLNVTAVGGVNAPINSKGQFVGPITAWGLQTSQGGACNNCGGTGGGVSKYFPLPAFQSSAGLVYSGRAVPDVSLIADGTTGVGVSVYGSFPAYAGVFSLGGTSIAAPQFAAMMALAVQACKQTASCTPGTSPYAYRFGNVNPKLYAAYANAATYKSTFYDVVFGDNSTLPGCAFTNPLDSTPCPNATPVPGYQAGVGYDPVTGIGVPFARHFVKALTGV